MESKFNQFANYLLRESVLEETDTLKAKITKSNINDEQKLIFALADHLKSLTPDSYYGTHTIRLRPQNIQQVCLHPSITHQVSPH